ncbi:MAG: hypothetical protein Q8J98_11225 [Phaeovulum sp.]|jgi:hypothetical protein|uniref:hypothetical protein n=1 Tax=Phaeovulum sp. TaxID=2934796 RepID=UPI002731CD86|nr:hypothetical protein [Phaeovulum sp.]MDP2063658.1 hypothetical protein [Phaeovulum sp.]
MNRLALIALLLLAACGPVPLHQAETECLEEARLAAQPRGEVGFGAGTGGAGGFANITISSDYLLGRDPAAVFDACVINKSGQRPSQPLYSRSDWKG